ncbi:MAG: hypothetical protein ACI9G1_004713 [Pirellulaceae bacterium]|jgi:hypothetical protein
MSDQRNREDEVKLSADEAKKLIDMIEDVERGEADDQERRKEAREIAQRLDQQTDEAA